eukprot:gene12925-9245_t
MSQRKAASAASSPSGTSSTARSTVLQAGIAAGKPAAGRGSTKVVPVFTFVCVDIEVPIRNAYLENFGFLGYADIIPVQFSITTNDSTLSAMWIGRNSDMEVRQVYTMDLSSLQVQVSMSIKNIGTSAASSLHFMRLMDPDPEDHLYSSYKTNNFVKYQPGYTDYTHPTWSNAAFVCAAGNVDMQFFAGLGTVDSRARVKHHQVFNVNPTQVYKETTWMSYGGASVMPYANYSSSMYYADTSIYLVYTLGDLDVDSTVHYDYSFVFKRTQIDLALDKAASFVITQPTDIVSGTDAVLQAILLKEGVTSASTCTFYLASNTSVGAMATWTHIGSAPAVAYSGISGTFTCTTTFDSTLFADGYMQLRVIVNISLSTSVTTYVYEKDRVVYLSNNGTQVAYTVANSNLSLSVNIYHGATVSLTLSPYESCWTCEILSIAYHLEYYNGNGGYVQTTRLTAATETSESITLGYAALGGLSTNWQAFVKASVVSIDTNGNGTSYTTTVVLGLLIDTEGTLAPTAAPTVVPSNSPTTLSTVIPSTHPTVTPSTFPTPSPSTEPTTSPSFVPTVAPTASPTASPTVSPTPPPTAAPSQLPTAVPSASPTAAPTVSPTAAPTMQPTATPTASPTVSPTPAPSAQPTAEPTAAPSIFPTAAPTTPPSTLPTAEPSVAPTTAPTAVPSIEPTAIPSALPTA